MPVFAYEGYDGSGAFDVGKIEARTEKLAYQILQSRGITVFSLTSGDAPAPGELPWFRRDIRLSRRGLPLRDQAIVADLLSALFGTGLSVADVIRTVAQSSERSDVRHHFERVGQRVADGSGLAEAFEAENRIFSPIFVSFLTIGEEANNLSPLLKKLARYFDGQNNIRQKVISALIYPAILLCAALGLLLMAILYLAPGLEPVFLSVGVSPPDSLRVLLALNSGLRMFWPYLLVAGTLGLVFILLALQSSAFRSMARSFWYGMPVLGTLLSLSTLARLVQSTEILLASGQTLAEALRTSAKFADNTSRLALCFEDAADAVEKGFSAASVFDAEQELPATFKALFRVGEETNRLASTLSALANAMSLQLDRYSLRLLSLLTPAITLVVGLGVGFLTYTLMGAIMDVNEIVF